ncbi:MAG: histidine phosphatase family protein [Gemmataceae bacterium]
MLPCIHDLVGRHADTTIAVVSHGVVNRVLLATWLDIPLRFARRLPQDNAAYNVVEFRAGKAKVRTVNRAAYLERAA